MRKVLVAAVAASSLLMVGAGPAMAQDPPKSDEVPPAFVPPTPGPVVDEASAEAFAEDYADDNARRFLRSDRRRVRVIDANARCLASPIVETRFGCVFTLRALVISRSRGWDGWGHKARASGKRGDDRRRHRRFRVRQYGCLGALTIDGGPTVTPTVQVRFVECARIPRGDREVVEPTG